MSTKTPSLKVGLAVSGLLAGFALVALAQEPVPVPSAGPESESASPADSRAVILKSDGTLLRHEGQVLEEREHYVLKNRVIEFRLPRRSVEKVFGSIEELYQYKLNKLPKRDPDEHMKFARWCLQQGLEKQAIEQLEAVLAWSSNDRQANAMLANLRSKADRLAYRDENIQQASATATATAETQQTSNLAPGAADPGMPRELDRSVIDEIRAYRGPVSKPVLFDLPDALAVRRFDEFRRVIHPIVQRRCAQCHDESSGRRFQVVRARVDKDLANDLLVRNNLDATLGLIDRSNPSHSLLLVNALTPHGSQPQPILDSKTPEFRALMTWASSLRHLSADPAAIEAGYVAPQSATPASGYGDGFASDRGDASAPRSSAAPAVDPLSGAIRAPVRNDVRTLQGEYQHPSVPPDPKFAPLPFSVQPQSSPFPDPSQTPGQPPAGIGPTGTPGSSPLAVPPPLGSEPLPGQGGATHTQPHNGEQIRRLPDGSAEITRPDGSKILRLADGTEIPMLDRRAVNQEASRPASERAPRQFEIPPDVIRQLNGPKGPSPAPVATPPR